jgi:hypothetical protein
MALETGTYINDLNSANPVSGDDIDQGDNHIRLLKSTILASFPNITGAMTKTHTELNDGFKIAGDAVQVVQSSTGTHTRRTATIPSDNSIPQITEGTEELTVAITPGNTSDLLKVEAIVYGSPVTVNAWIMAAIFNTDVHATNALSAAAQQPYGPSISGMTPVHICHFLTAPSAAETTFRLRVGADTGSLDVNGYNNAGLLGGVIDTMLSVTQYKV